MGAAGDCEKILGKNLIKLTSYTNTLLKSLFDNCYSMPVGIRIICRLTTLLASEKFPNMTKKDHYQLLSSLLFTNWIIPAWLNPDSQDIVDDFSKNRQTANEVAKLFQKIITQELYPTSDPLSVLNTYITSFKSSMEEYLDELLEINSKVLQELSYGDNIAKENIKLLNIRCHCLSVDEILVLARNIALNESKIKEIDQTVGRLAKNLIDREKDLPIYTQKLKPEHTYVNYFELKFPKNVNTPYVEEFLRIQNYSKDLPESQKLVAKCKHILKQILLTMEDIKDLSVVAYNDEMTIEEILQFAQEKINTNETRLVKKKRQTSVYLSSRFLLTYIKKLDPIYRVNNFQRLFSDMVHELNDIFSRLFEKMHNNKIQLLRGIDSLRRKNEQMRDVNHKKCKALHRLLIRDFLNTAKLSLCLRFPTNPLPEDKLAIQNQRECIVGKLAFINELTSSTVVNLTNLKDPKKKTPAPTTQTNLNQSVREASAEHQHFHCHSVNMFIDAFASLPVVREAILPRADNTDKESRRVSEAYSKFLQILFDIVSQQITRFKDEDRKIVQEEIENYVGKRLNFKIFPLAERSDESFWIRCKTLEWLDFNHLEVPEATRCPEIWNYAASKFAEIDYKLTPISKTNAILEGFNIISYVIHLATMKNDFGADDLTPVLIYTMLRWCPKRIYSNLKYKTSFDGILDHLNLKSFMSKFRYDFERVSKEIGGYYTENVRGVVNYLENLDHKAVSIDMIEFEKLVHEKELKYEIYFLRTRPRTDGEMLNFTAVRERRKRLQEEKEKEKVEGISADKTDTADKIDKSNKSS